MNALTASNALGRDRGLAKDEISLAVCEILRQHFDATVSWQEVVHHVSV